MSAVEERQGASSVNTSNLFLQLDRMSSELVERRSTAPSPGGGAAVFRNLDKMSSELRHERNLRENAIESARKSLRDRERLVTQIREVRARATAIVDVKLSPRTAASQLRDTMDSLSALIPDVSLDAGVGIACMHSRRTECSTQVAHSGYSTPRGQIADEPGSVATPKTKPVKIAAMRVTPPGVHVDVAQAGSPQVGSPDMVSVAAAAAAAAVARSVQTASPSVAAAEARRLTVPKAASPRPAAPRAGSQALTAESRPPIAEPQTEMEEEPKTDPVEVAAAAAARARAAAARIWELYGDPAPAASPSDFTAPSCVLGPPSSVTMIHKCSERRLFFEKNPSNTVAPIPMPQKLQQLECFLSNTPCKSDMLLTSDADGIDESVGRFATSGWSTNLPYCAYCNVTFSLLNRRHHCRKCGNCVCAACSPFRLQLRAPVERPSTPMRMFRALTPQGQRPSSRDSSLAQPDSPRNAIAAQPQAHRVCVGCHGAMVQVGRGQEGGNARERLVPPSRQCCAALAAKAGA